MRNFVPMKSLFNTMQNVLNNSTFRILNSALIVALLFSSCKKSAADMPKLHFKVEAKCPVTPVKNQGRSQTCWIYAMLATIESNRIAMGDSVNLSPTFLERMLLQKEAEKVYNSKGKEKITLRGMIPYCMQLIDEYGAFNFDSYYCKNKEFSMKETINKLQSIAEETAGKKGESIEKLRRKTKELLDNEISFLPKNQFFLGAGYTPQEFGNSVALYEHYEFLGADYNFPDRRKSDKITKTSPAQMLEKVEQSVRKGYAVCWEGDISEDGFCWEAGLAIDPLLLPHEGEGNSHKENAADFNKRYEEGIENDDTTDDHCLEICGIAHDQHGRKYFVCKNSWGISNRYKGFLFMSFDYFLTKTILIGKLKDNYFFSASVKLEDV